MATLPPEEPLYDPEDQSWQNRLRRFLDLIRKDFSLVSVLGAIAGAFIFWIGVLIFQGGDEGGGDIGGGTGLGFSDFRALDSIPFDEGPGKRKSFMIMKLDSLEFGFPPAANQGKQGACTAFSVAYGVISYYESQLLQRGYDIQPDGKPHPSRVFSPSFVFNSLCKGNCNQGIGFIKAFKFIRKKGVCYWQDHKFDSLRCAPAPGTTAQLKAKDFVGYSFYKIEPDAATLISYLQQGFPVIIGIYTSSSMHRLGLKAPKDKPYHWKPAKTDLEAYHAMVCTGYDPITESFVLYNSWGTKWGQFGYCYISKKRFMERFREAYIMRLTRQTPTKELAIQNHEFYEMILDRNKPSYDSMNILQRSIAQRKQFADDLNALRALKNRTAQQDILINELEDYLKNGGD